MTAIDRLVAKLAAPRSVSYSGLHQAHRILQTNGSVLPHELQAGDVIEHDGGTHVVTESKVIDATHHQVVAQKLPAGATRAYQMTRQHPLKMTAVNRVAELAAAETAQGGDGPLAVGPGGLQVTSTPAMKTAAMSGGWNDTKQMAKTWNDQRPYDEGGVQQVAAKYNDMGKALTEVAPKRRPVLVNHDGVSTYLHQGATVMKDNGKGGFVLHGTIHPIGDGRFLSNPNGTSPPVSHGSVDDAVKHVMDNGTGQKVPDSYRTLAFKPDVGAGSE